MECLPVIMADVPGAEDDGSGMSAHRWHTLLELLRGADVAPVSQAGLMMGEIATSEPKPLLLGSFEMRAAHVASWSDLLTRAGLSGLLSIRTARLGGDEEIDEERLPLLSGLGFVVASAGMSGEPLVEMGAARLRHELKESRRLLSAACGYEVRILAPVPHPDGRAFDALVLEEARRIGYTLFLEPGEGLNGSGECAARRLSYRSPTDNEPLRELRNWVVGDGTARTVHRVKHRTRGLLRIARRLRARLS